VRIALLRRKTPGRGHFFLKEELNQKGKPMNVNRPLCWHIDDLDEAKLGALKTIVDFYEKSHDERAEPIYLLDALDYLHDDLLAWAHIQGGK
jgi:hypothetical protein